MKCKRRSGELAAPPGDRLISLQNCCCILHPLMIVSTGVLYLEDPPMKTPLLTMAVLALSAFTANQSFSGFLDDVGKVVTAPIRAPIQATKDVLNGAPPGKIIQNQVNIQVAPQAHIFQDAATVVQKGHDIVTKIPRDAIQRNLGGDWLRGYDILTASQRVQFEIAMTSGRFLAQCAQTQQCGINQLTAIPVAAAMRDAYRAYVTYSYPLHPSIIPVLSRVVPPQVLASARWTVGNTPDFTVPGFLNSANSLFGSQHAVTLANVMIFSQMPNLQSNDWVWLLHEMFHIEQYMRYSGDPLESIDGFAVDYVDHYNQMESEAQNNAVARFNLLRQSM
jgi:hypothetical protein